MPSIGYNQSQKKGKKNKILYETNWFVKLKKQKNMYKEYLN